ncbi:Asp-tRNA(Asn)/Glu-tRNA(Gln) amidotransferase subunit GatC [Zavarzinella formosa]|uniref:Asp-tRNA(Asn)/Glu-tRNA(Gln) amidotransferase subunit GatC n=1 Tax=Zavarzinella formosa TaxID=360055 RepID=UPI00031A47CF|nr:Asp-tRNA(Asn)/Glu-tRNA(Gln) amidotransferase subunit GatC [Zavarzinella formosa]
MDIDNVRKVAKLARLDLSEADLATMTTQLSAILSYVDQLKELDTDNVEPMAHPLPLKNVFRPDELRPSLPVDEALKNAPARSGDFFAVPAILDAGDDLSH